MKALFRKYLYIVLIVPIIGALIFVNEKVRIEPLKEEVEVSHRNIDALTHVAESYKTSGDLNAVKTLALELTIAEYEKIMANDKKIIEQLNIDKRNISSAFAIHLESESTFKGNFRDTVFETKIEDRIIRDTMKWIDLVYPWWALHGMLNMSDNFSFEGQHKSWQELGIVATVTHKRFLGFLWRTKKILKQEVDAASADPETEITKLNFVLIRK